MTTLILELLDWVAASPRTYGETMDAWRSSCPRMTVWEDATSDGLVEVVYDDGPAVRLTPLGRDVLAAATLPSRG